MERNVEDIKRKIMEKLPELLPKAAKSLVVYIVMLIYHVSMPPWVTAIRVKKAMNSHNTKDNENRNTRRRRRLPFSFHES